MATRDQIVEEARTYLGARWVHMGRTKTAVDCAGLVSCVAKTLQFSTYDFLGYGRQAFDHTFLTHFRNNMRVKPLAQVKKGDVLAFYDAKYPCHVAVVGEKYGQLSIIHAYVRRHRVVEELLTPEWRAAVVECYEFIGVED